VALLLELALVINTTTTRTLPRNKTPFEVWFGWKPRWITAGLIDDVDDEDQDLQDDTNNDNKSGNNEDPVLSEIEARVVANNARLHTQMIKANSGWSAIFTNGTIATLQIPLKLRLATKPSRLPVRVLTDCSTTKLRVRCEFTLFFPSVVPSAGRLANIYVDLRSLDSLTLSTHSNMIPHHETTVPLKCHIVHTSRIPY